ncbi:MAG: hypothetical protein WCR07_10150 [Verrucomicrobiota bacterium]|jgi:hypothetical protein
MSPMESQMQVQKGLLWATLLLGALVFGFFMASETMLLVLAVAGVGWLVTLPHHARLSALMGMATGGSALIMPLFPGRPFVWEVAGLLGWSGVVTLLATRKYSPGFGERLRRYRWIVLLMLGYVLVLFYLMRTHGFGLRVLGGDRMGGRQYLQQVGCASFALVFLTIRLSEADLVRWFTIHLLLSLTFLVSDIALAVGGPAMGVFYFLDLAVDSVQFEFGSEATGIRRFQSFALVSMALLQWLVMVVPLRKVFSSSAIWLVPALVGTVALGLPGGHRAVLMLECGFLVTCAWAQGVIRPLRLVFVSSLMALVLLLAYALGPELPLSAQRALSVLPGIQLDPVAVADAQKTYEGRVVMREVGIQLIPDFLWRGRGFGQSTDTVPLMMAQDPYGTIAEHVEYGRFYNGPVGLMVNTGLPGTVCLMGVILAGSMLAMRTLLHVRRHGAEDVFLRLACANAAYWLMKVGIFVFIHGDSEYALNTFGLHLGMVMAVDYALSLRERAEARATDFDVAPTVPIVSPAAVPWWRRRHGGGPSPSVAVPLP